MKFFFILFVIGFLIYFLLFWHFGSPYKIEVLFGKQGSGKTTYMVKRMLRDLKRGWNVYTDIPDISIPGVRSFSTFDLCDNIPDQRSICYLDEAGISFDGREFKKLSNGMRDLLCLHRHYRVSLVFSSQTYDIDKKIRDRAHKLYLVQGYGRLSLIRPIKRSITLTEASSQAESRIADQLRFEWPLSWRFCWLPRYQCWFDSFTAPEREKLSYELQSGKEKPWRELKKMQRSFNRRKLHKRNRPPQ